MAIYIKGIDMPKTAFECSTKVNPDERRCNYTGKVFEETYGLVVEHTCPNCPLTYIPEPHGRLIDADAICGEMKEYSNMVFKTGYLVSAKNKFYKLNELLEEAPTVIEGSE